MSGRDLGDLNHIVGRNVLGHLQDRGWPVADLSGKTGIPPRSLCTKLGRYGKWSAAEVIAVADAFGVQASELLGGAA